jgi:anti-anti-sigma regulatory factor
MASRKDRMKLHNWNGVTVLDLGEVEIWDGADLSLLRDTFTNLIDKAGCRSIGVNMSYVKYIPSGFFGMLFDWHERGASMRLYSPQPHVARMLWFRQFFEHETNQSFLLQSEPKELLVQHDPSEWNNEPAWDEGELDTTTAVSRNA